MTQSQAPAGDVQAQRMARMRQRVADLAAEAESLARQDLPSDAFTREFLSRVIAALGAKAGVLWSLRDSGFEPGSIVGEDSQFAETLLKPREDQRRGFCASAAEQGQPLAARLQGVNESGDGWVGMFAPILVGKQTLGMLEIAQRDSLNPSAREGNLRFVQRMAAAAAEHVRNVHMRRLADMQAWRDRFDSLLARLHETLDPQIIASTFAAEAPAILGCDRVSVYLSHGGRWTLAAVSGQELFDRRADGVKLLERIVSLAARRGQAVAKTAAHDESDPGLSAALDLHFEKSGAQWLIALPLDPQTKLPLGANTEPTQEPGSAPTVPSGRFGRRSPFPRPAPASAWMVVEGFAESPSPNREAAARIAFAARRAGAATVNAAKHQRIFLLPLWSALGGVWSAAFAWRLVRWGLAASVVLGIFWGLTTYETQFSVEGRGTLEPSLRRDVFARVDGVVREVNVRHGDHVEAGQVLAVLGSEELAARRTILDGELQRVERELLSLKSTRTTQWTPDERSRHAGRIQTLETTQQGVQRQIEVLQRQSEELQVVSPTAGEIITWDVENLLTARPVSRGHVLLTVADLNGGWQLEIPMPEDRLGYVLEAGMHAASEGRSLEVQFVLATEPGKLHQGVVSRLAGRAEIDAEQGNSVRMIVSVDADQLPPELLRPGASATAKIDCGRRSMGFVLFHEVGRWFQRHVLFRID